MRACLLVLASLLSLPSAPSAQSSGPTSKGNALVGGTASISRTTQKVRNDDDQSTTFVRVSPEILYFIAPRVAVGGVFSYARASSDGSTSHSRIFGPELQVFLADPAAWAQPYLGASVARQWTTFDFDVSRSTQSSTSYGATAGVIWMITRQVGISTEGYYLRSSQDAANGDAPDISVNGLGLRFGFAAFLMR